MDYHRSPRSPEGLSHELEENHTETEKQLNEDLGASNFKNLPVICRLNFFHQTEAQFRGRLRKIEILEELCVEYGGIPTSNVRSSFYHPPFFYKANPEYIFQQVRPTAPRRNPNRFLRLLGQQTSCP